MYEYKNILVEVENGLCTLTLNRPEVRNAINSGMLKDLNDFLPKAKEDPEIRALVITGAGKGFSSGADLGEWDEVNDAGGEGADLEGANWVTWGHNMILGLKNFPKPVIAAVNGAAAGAGCDMALAADIRFGSTNAKFGEAYINVGYCPDNGGTYLLPRVVGWSKATEMIFTGDLVKAEEALKIGLIDHLTTPEDLMTEAKAFARRLAEGPTVAIGQSKLLLAKSWYNSFESQLDAESAAGEVCQATEDSAEAVKAFAERRAPVFKGR